VNPGDIVLADDDGILVLPPDRVQEIVDTFTPRVRQEPESHKKLLSGMSLADMSGAKVRLEQTLQGER
jgi:4-hydroxy-4-methyl-2-oxoglutarate aldolase